MMYEVIQARRSLTVLATCTEDSALLTAEAANIFAEIAVWMAWRKSTLTNGFVTTVVELPTVVGPTTVATETLMLGRDCPP